MGRNIGKDTGLPPEQQVIRAQSFHPTGTFIPLPREAIEQSIPGLFEQYIQRHRDQRAIKSRTHDLTYGKLNQMANRVAHAILARRGVGEEPIALLCEHDAPVIAAILGVLKAGKFCVPLDPYYPGTRITAILEDAQAPLIVTDSQHLGFAREIGQHRCQVLNIDDVDTSLSAEAPGLAVAPDNLALLIYTSGSTGQPKGVGLSHRNVLHHTMVFINNFHICAHDRLTLLRSVSVSGSTWSILSALLTGACLYPLNVKKEGVAPLATWLIQEAITVCVIGSPLFRIFLDTLSGEETFPHLRLIRLASQTVYKQDVERYKYVFSPDCLLINSLGSTETGIVRMYFMDKKTSITGSLVPIGYAIEDMACLVLNETGEEVGHDRVGEIAVRSRYLPSGYWRRPELTPVAFLPDPQGGEARIYRTGDLGRLRPDDCLEHLGRKDSRVKIRGYRVEISEVEIALHDLDSVKEAVVVVREDRPGDPRLVAYIVAATATGAMASTLRRALVKTLPDYMVPSAYVMLDALPLAPNGKVDRPALPLPGLSRPELSVAFVAPRTPVEEMLARIWAEVLGLDDVGVHDPFLELGGDSLLAMRLMTRVLTTFHVNLPLRVILEAATVARMAVVIDQYRAQQATPEEWERMLVEVEGLSDERVDQRLADDTESGKLLRRQE